MNLIGYCIRRAGEPPPGEGLRGVEGGEVFVLEHASLGMWISRGVVEAPSPERLLEHDRVVRSALRSATPLPLRFGSSFDDEVAVRTLIDARRDDFLAGLERVAGRVEIGVTLLWNTEAERAHVLGEHSDTRGPDRQPETGLDYLEGRGRKLAVERALQQRARERLVEVHDMLTGGTEVPTVRQIMPREGVAGSIALLVPRSALGEYRRRVENARPSFPELRLALSGPWAPYSFA